MFGAVIRGTIAGTVGTWVMDAVTTVLFDAQAPDVKRAEVAAQPNRKSSVANLVDRIERSTGVVVAEDNRPQVEQATHYSLGIGPAVAYAEARKVLPLRGPLAGILFGLLVFGLNDEYANSALGLSGPPGAYPLQSHLRGLAGHLAYGVTVQSTLELLGG